jgi:hypothetical protein
MAKAQCLDRWATSRLTQFRPWLFTAAVLLGITWLTFSRLLGEGIADHVYLFGRETLRAVQAWENHGFFAMAGFFPLGGSLTPHFTYCLTGLATIYSEKLDFHFIRLV